MKEGAKENLVAGDLSGVPFGATAKLVDIEGGVVRERVHLEVGPEHLDGIQLRGVGGEENRVDGAVAATEPGRGASMDVEAIPHEDDGRTELSAERPDKPKKVWGDDVLVGQERKVKSHSASPGGDGECRDHRDALMGASALIKDGRLSHGRPSATDEWGHEKPALVQENKGCLQPPGVFFYPGPLGSHPPLARRLVALAGPPLGFLGTKPERPKQTADVVGMILHPEAATNEIDHAGARPQVGGIPEGRGPFEEHVGKLLPVIGFKLGRAARGGHGREAIGPLVTIRPKPSMDRATVDTEASCDLAGEEAFLEQRDGFQSPFLEGLGISEGSHVSPPNRSMRH